MSRRTVRSSDPGPRGQLDTRERILAAAEEAFVAHGFAGTSLRTITSSAGVNLAAVNYHFGSKEALIQEVFARHLGPLNQARIAHLDRLEAEAKGMALPSWAALTGSLTRLWVRVKLAKKVLPLAGL